MPRPTKAYIVGMINYNSNDYNILPRHHAVPGLFTFGLFYCMIEKTEKGETIS